MKRLDEERFEFLINTLSAQLSQYEAKSKSVHARPLLDDAIIYAKRERTRSCGAYSIRSVFRPADSNACSRPCKGFVIFPKNPSIQNFSVEYSIRSNLSYELFHSLRMLLSLFDFY